MELFTTKKNYQVRALDFDLKFEVVQIVLLRCDKLNLEGPTNSTLLWNLDSICTTIKHNSTENW